ncbi:MAG: dTDP-4-dehydrorhamnose reductase [Pseudomonadota bacterium]|nr:dTDP-4-dehydrorhamnose reductase [Pseudomonadota bacterium]
MIRVLVTGARGQVGAEVARELDGRATVLAYDRFTLDLAQPDQLAGRVRAARPDVIVNAAAYTAVDAAEADVDRARAVNAIAPGVIAEEAKRANALLIHFSTDYVFDGRKAAPYIEADATNPLGAYGRTKLEGERAVAASGCRHLILRTSWVYGPHGKNFLLTMLRLGATRPELRVVDDQRGAPTSSRSLARLVRELLDRDGDMDAIQRAEVDQLGAASGLYHATADGTTTWFGFAAAIFDEAARQGRLVAPVPRLVPIATRDYPTPAKRPANSVLSSARLESAFGVRIPGWRRGLEETVSALPGG